MKSTRIAILIFSTLLILTALLLKKRSDDNAWRNEKKAIARQHQTDLLPGHEITVRLNPDGSPIKVQIVRAPKPRPYILSPVGDFDTAHERELRQRSQSVGEIGLRPSITLQQDPRNSR